MFKNWKNQYYQNDILPTLLLDSMQYILKFRKLRRLVQVKDLEQNFKV